MGMAYSIDYRKRVLEYLEEGHTQAEAKKVFKVGITTIKEWKKLLSETGSLEKRPLDRESRVYKSDELSAYMEEHPQALLKEIAKHFGGSTSGANSALARGKITFKKRQPHTVNDVRKGGPNLMRNKPKSLLIRRLYTLMSVGSIVICRGVAVVLCAVNAS